MKFSVIIPAYNAEKYLLDCICSVIGQDFPIDQYEILVVDDASASDQSYCINNLCASYHNVRFFRHSKNKRQGGARNTALEQAKGDWIFFLDSDDCWLYDNVFSTFSKLIDLYPGVDIIRFAWYDSISSDCHPEIPGRKMRVTDKATVLEDGSALANQDFNYIIWTSCYKRSLITDNRIRFRENVSFEDSDWATEAYGKSKKCLWIDGSFYGYRQTCSSTTRGANIKAFKDNIASIFAIDNLLKSLALSDASEKSCHNRIKKSILSYIRLSRFYKTRASIDALKPLMESGLMKTARYDLSAKESVLLFLFRHCTYATVAAVRILYKIKKALR